MLARANSTRASVLGGSKAVKGSEPRGHAAQRQSNPGEALFGRNCAKSAGTQWARVRNPNYHAKVGLDKAAINYWCIWIYRWVLAALLPSNKTSSINFWTPGNKVKQWPVRPLKDRFATRIIRNLVTPSRSSRFGRSTRSIKSKSSWHPPPAISRYSWWASIPLTEPPNCYRSGLVRCAT